MNRECFMCMKEFKTNPHLYNCARRNNVSYSRKELLKHQFLYEHGNETIKSIIEKYKEGVPTYELKKEFKMDVALILNAFEINIRNISESKMTNYTKEKTTKTLTELAGGVYITNPAQLNSTKEKVKTKSIEKYGVDNVRKSEWFKKHYNDIMNERYGKGSLGNRYGNSKITWANKTKEERTAHFKPANDAWKIWYHNLSDEELTEYIRLRSVVSKKGGSARNSKLEILMAKTLDELGIKYEWQFTLNRKSYDFILLDRNILIEMNGDFWHANPKFYSENEEIIYPGNNDPVLAKDRWQRDKIKANIAHENGYKLIIIWEDEVKLNQNNFTEYVKNLLNHLTL